MTREQFFRWFLCELDIDQAKSLSAQLQAAMQAWEPWKVRVVNDLAAAMTGA